MKSRLMFAVVIATLFIGCGSTNIASRPEELVTNKISFKPGEPIRWQLNNGLVIYYYFDNELPIVSGSLYTPGGGLYEPQGMGGLAAATGEGMRDGGVKDLKASELDLALDSLGASVESSFTSDYGVVGFKTHQNDFEKVFSLFSQVVINPRFEEDRFELWKVLALDGIRRRKDSPETMAALIFTKAVFGDNSPYSQQATTDSITKLKIDNVRAFHRMFVRPKGSRLAISGAVDEAVVRKAVEKFFGAWVEPQEPLPNMPQPNLQREGGIYILNREFKQAAIIIGHDGPPRVTDDMFAINVFNRIFGASGFESILFNEIRSKYGLAYSVYGGIFGGPGAGTFQVVLGTRNSEIPNAVNKVKDTINDNYGQVFEPSRVNDAKSALQESFAFKFEDASEIVKRRAMLEHLGFPPGYDQNFIARVNQVVPEDMAKVSQKWIHPEQLVTVVVGKVKVEALKRQLPIGQKVYEVGFDEIPKIIRMVN